MQRTSKSIVVIGLSLILLIACNKNAKRFNAKTTINPELLGSWVSSDKCSLTLKKINNTLMLVSYTNKKQQHFTNLPLTFSVYNIAIDLSNQDPKAQTFNAQYMDGTIIINSCQALHKISN